MGNCVDCIRDYWNLRPKIPNKLISDRMAYDPQALNIRKVDLLIDKNSYRHYTNKYNASTRLYNRHLVIRRGFPFHIRIVFEKTINLRDDLINLVFRVKDIHDPNYAQKTEIILPVKDENANDINLNNYISNKNFWNISVIEWELREILVEITPASDTYIGEWALNIETKSKAQTFRKYSIHKVRESIYILFNPWHQGDLTYLKDESQRSEYVLNDSGIIWKGTSNLLRPSPWNFSQFEEHVLECCIYLLTKVGNLVVTDRADPVKVSRHLSLVVNYDFRTGDGVLVGNWNAEIKNGISPSAWLGSMLILQQYYLTKKPVKYAQCWVYSGVLTTVCRCLGLPSRPVTNYLSAHDTHNSLTVDRILNEDGELLDQKTGDSVWNFHTWVESWFKRLDLSYTGVYDGWQVIDSTPQEPSDGLYRLGPTSVNAIRNGEVLKQYDGTFVFAEVNADEVFWLKRGDREPFKYLGSNTTIIGANMSTKAVGSNSRVDITSDYKYKESTPEEREVMLKALKTCKNIFSRYYLNAKFNDIRFDLILIDDIVIGESFRIRLRIENRSYKVYTVQTVMSLRTTLYTGVSYKTVKKERRERRISPKSEYEITLDVNYDDYGHLLIDQNSFATSVMAQVIETDFHYFAMDDFRVRMPDIKIYVEGDVFEWRPFTCHAYFMNPLPRRLTNGVFIIEGPGLGKPLRIPLTRPVEVRERAHVSFTLTPRSDGEKTISARFTSRELTDVDGARRIRVSRRRDRFFNNFDYDLNIIGF